MIEIDAYLDELTSEFKHSANHLIARQQQDYLQGKFAFFGIKTPERRLLQKPFLEKGYLPAKEQLNEIIRRLWDRPERDFQLFGLDLVMKYKKKLTEDDLMLFEFMITNKSWWDIVDLTATHMVGGYFKQFGDQRDDTIERWMTTGNLWLQRSCLIFQLKYKDQLDEKLLSDLIRRLLGSDEFFINKAIGWILREHSKTNANWVRNFVASHELSPLSHREALRLIK